MLKPKLYLYSTAKEHVHDNIDSYHGVVPFSKYHIDQFDLVGPEEADIIYMGQFSDGNYTFIRDHFQYFDRFRGKHWADIEGDWLGQEIPQELNGINITINGARKELFGRFNRMFVRPTFSTLFVGMRDRVGEYECRGRSFGFMGYPDPYGVRVRLRNILTQSGLPHEFTLTGKWNGPALLNGSEHKEYERRMLKHTFSLCPRGAGHDSVRFYESCFYGRIPVIIGDNLLFGELEGLDVSFCTRISQYSSDEQIQNKFEELLELDDEEVFTRSLMAKRYFNEVRKYLQNSTKYLLGVIHGIQI